MTSRKAERGNGGEPRPGDPAETNIRAVARLEAAARQDRSLLARISYRVTEFAASALSIALHLLWFVVWALWNSGQFPSRTFDPFPFPILTSIVSLEAIFLTLLVLASQNRLTVEADHRAHLDLQINLLAEQEMTLVLRMLQELCEHFELNATTHSKEFQVLIQDTDLSDLAARVQRQIQARSDSTGATTEPSE